MPQFILCSDNLIAPDHNRVTRKYWFLTNQYYQITMDQKDNLEVNYVQPIISADPTSSTSNLEHLHARIGGKTK